MVAKIVLATMTVLLLLWTLNSFGAAMTCNNMEDQGVCSKDCRGKGFGYGKCDFGDCSCYGSRRPTDRSDEDDSREKKEEEEDRDRGQGQYEDEEGLIDRYFNGVRRRPVSQTSSNGKRRRLCTSELTQIDVVPSHHRCRKFCSWLHSKVDISMDNICCCVSSSS